MVRRHLWGRHLRVALWVATLGGTTAGVLAQDGSKPGTATAAVQAAPLPRYDVATVKLNTTGSNDSSFSWQDRSIAITNTQLKELLQNAFDVKPNMVFGLPSWAEKAHYDLSAKVLDADAEAIKKMTPEQSDQMMRDLLVSRFALKTHYETRPMPVYELVVAKGGIKIVPSKHNEHDSSWNWSSNLLKADGMLLHDFADILTRQFEKPVLDKTALAGRYDFELKWSPDQGNSTGNAGQGAEAGGDSDAPPPLFTAIQEQLGLRLQAAKDPVRVLVVDSIAPPTEN